MPACEDALYRSRTPKRFDGENENVAEGRKAVGTMQWQKLLQLFREHEARMSIVFPRNCRYDNRYQVC